MLALSWGGGIWEEGLDRDLGESRHDPEVLEFDLPGELWKGGLSSLDRSDHVWVFSGDPHDGFSSHGNPALAEGRSSGDASVVGGLIL
jgi:hypothetical protein